MATTKTEQTKSKHTKTEHAQLFSFRELCFELTARIGRKFTGTQWRHLIE